MRPHRLIEKRNLANVREDLLKARLREIADSEAVCAEDRELVGLDHDLLFGKTQCCGG